MENDHPEVTEAKEHFELWSFPPLNDLAANIDTEVTATSAQESEATQETNSLKESLTHQLELFTGINQQFAEAIKQIDETLLTQMINCMKKAVHKIITAELNKNDDALAAMIQQTLQALESLESCTVLLSPDDFNRLQTIKLDCGIAAFQADATLTQGDYKITSPAVSINAILTDRIDALFGLNK